MLVLVTGGSGSGKSEFAENIAVSFGGERTYIAAMKPSEDAECRERIERHRKMRALKCFKTVECYSGIKKLNIGGTAVLECMSNLLANEMFGEGGDGAVGEILDGIRYLNETCDNLIVVTNEIASDGVDYVGDTKKYMRYLGMINREIAKEADTLYEVVCGLPNKLRGRDEK